MVNVIKSERSDIYIIEGEGSEELWCIDDMKKLKKFNNWVKRHCLKPGDIIPKRIFKKYFKRCENNDRD